MIDTKQISKDSCVIIIDSAESISRFKELVQRGSNLWPDANPEIKEFADVITNDGWVMQDYYGQDTSKN